ncbi:MAG: hypothetical protein FWF31_12655, partial [Desulfobulbus sp.]|nr:hypothetical protein [Desulfobulbus sp.]
FTEGGQDATRTSCHAKNTRNPASGLAVRPEPAQHRTCGVGKTTVDDTINRATAAGLSWPLPFDLDDEALELRLYPPVVASTRRKLSSPDLAVHP